MWNRIDTYGLKGGEHPSVQLWHHSVLMCGPVRHFPEVVWTEQIAGVVSVQTIVVVFTGA